MASSIKFDSTDIVGTTYVPRFVKHESVADRILSTLGLARDDGEVFVSDRRGVKKVQLQGIITGTTQANLEAQIDTMTELFSRTEKNLDVDWNGSTRRYVATCTKHEFDRDHFHLLFCPWTAEFTVLSGEGKDTSTTAALTAHVVTTTTPGTDSFTLLGSKPPKPYIVIQGSNFPSNCSGIEYKNTDTGEKIVITHSLTSTDYLIIDCANKKCYHSSDLVTLTEVPFYGVFPKFKIGTNNVQISCGYITNQSSVESYIGAGGALWLGNNFKNGNSFQVPYTDSTFRAITVAIYKSGSPTSMTFRIETDSNGSPSGTLAHANATWTVAAASVGTLASYITLDSTGGAFTLNANQKYWLVATAAGTDGAGNEFAWEQQSNIYPKGTLKRSTDSGATYVANIPGAQFAFKILMGGSGGTSSVKHSVTYTKTYL